MQKIKFFAWPGNPLHVLYEVRYLSRDDVKKMPLSKILQIDPTFLEDAEEEIRGSEKDNEFRSMMFNSFADHAPKFDILEEEMLPVVLITFIISFFLSINLNLRTKFYSTFSGRIPYSVYNRIPFKIFNLRFS